MRIRSPIQRVCLTAILVVSALGGARRVRAQNAPDPWSNNFGPSAPSSGTVPLKHWVEPVPPGKKMLAPNLVGSLTYQGGMVISNVQTVSVLWGPSTDASVKADLPPFLDAVLNSPYMDWLCEYDTLPIASSTHQVIGRGSYAGQVTIVPNNPGLVLSDGDIQNELTWQLSHGFLPLPQYDAGGYPITMYVIEFPAGMSVTSNGGSCQWGGFCAYHSAMNYAGKPLMYSVHPDFNPHAGSICDIGCGGGTMVQNQESVHTHEIIEAVTDPMNGLSTLGWYDWPDNGEIGDLCNQNEHLLAINGHNWVVQAEWSDTQNSCIVVNPNLAAGPTMSGTSGVSPGGTITLNASGGSSPYEWNFNPGAGEHVIPGVTGATLTIAGATSANTGSYAVVSQGGCTRESSPWFVTVAPLSAIAHANPTQGVAPFTVNFSGSGLGGTPPYTYAWDFGDGGTGTGALTSHLYTVLGLHTVNLTVTDSASATAAAPPLTITVCGSNTASPASVGPWTAGTYYSTAFTGGGGVGPYTMNLLGALPTGVGFNTSTSTLSGTPMQLGTFPLTLQVTDANGCETDLPYSLTVVCPVVTISPTSLAPPIIGSKYCAQLTASGCVGSCTFSILSGALPTGLTMDGTGYISGIPTAHGSFSFTVRATTILGCHGDQAYTLKDYNLVFLDDYGRSRFYGDRVTGAYEWDILTGPGTGSYSGVAYVENGGAKFVSKPGDLNTLNVTYDPVAKKASGYFIENHIYSGLTDANTGNDIPSCP
jgi:PKD repeat protein